MYSLHREKKYYERVQDGGHSGQAGWRGRERGETGAEPKKGLCRVETKIFAKKTRDKGEASPRSKSVLRFGRAGTVRRLSTVRYVVPRFNPRL